MLRKKKKTKEKPRPTATRSSKARGSVSTATGSGAKRVHALTSRATVILGASPAIGEPDPWGPLTRSGKRLADLVGVKPDKLRELFELDNLVPYPEPSRQALRDAGQLYRFDPSKCYVIAGTEVQRALGRRARAVAMWSLASSPVLQWFVTGEGITMAILPHPSGRNRWYNAPERKDAARAFLRRTL